MSKETTEQREQALLRNLYEIQDELGELLDDGEKDPHYVLMTTLIERLEEHLKGRQSTII
jgi:hypothetical protein